jgi:hypothetical protein
MYLFACGETSVVKSSEGGHDPILNMERTSDHHNAPTYPFACGKTPVVRSGGGGGYSRIFNFERTSGDQETGGSADGGGQGERWQEQQVKSNPSTRFFYP